MPRGSNKNPKATKQTSKKIASKASDLLRDSKDLSNELRRVSVMISQLAEAMAMQKEILRSMLPVLRRASETLNGDVSSVAASALGQKERKK